MRSTRSLLTVTLSGVLALSLAGCSYEFRYDLGDGSLTTSASVAGAPPTADLSGFTSTSVDPIAGNNPAGTTVEVDGFRFLLPEGFDAEPNIYEGAILSHRYLNVVESDGVIGSVMTSGRFSDVDSHEELYAVLSPDLDVLPDGEILSRERISVNGGDYEVLAIHHTFSFDSNFTVDGETLEFPPDKRYAYDWYVQQGDSIAVLMVDMKDHDPDLMNAILTSFEFT